MVVESSSASFEAPKKIENFDTGRKELPDLSLEKTEKPAEKPAEILPAKNISQAAVPAPTPSYYEERRKNIEMAMSKGMEEIYLALNSEQRAQFRRVGEETAEKINQLLEKTKIKIGKIVALIKQWLAILPGVNKFFLEQEAKIRADEVIKLKK